MIDTEVLRKKVIDLAIQGKLTQQLPEDGNAEDLYVKIQKDKAKLIKEGRIKKEKSLPEISDDEIPFEIPKTWKWVKVASIGVTVTGNTPSKTVKEYFGGNYPFYKPADLDSGRHISKGSETLTEFGIEETRYIKAGTILVCCIGTIGKAAIIDVDGACNQQINALSPLICDSDFLLFVVNSDCFQRQLEKNSRATTVSIIKKSLFDQCVVPLPPLDEQRRIVSLLNSLFDHFDTIDVLQQQYESDREILKGKIIDAGIRGKLTEQLSEDGNAEDLYASIQKEKANLIKEGKIKKEKPLPEISDDEVPFEIPSNWKWVRFGDIARIYGGKRIPAGRSLTDIDTGHKYIRVSDMKGGTVLADNLLYVPEDIYPSISRYIINKEDIYITVAGTIGKVGKIPPDIDGANLTENADRIVFDNLDQNWLIWCLSASFIQKQIMMLTTQVAQPKLAITRIQDFIIPLPPLAEQNRIASIIDTFMQTINY